MIETFKIVTRIYDTVVSRTMLGADSSYATRGYDFRLQRMTARYDLRKLNYFKNRLDNFWKDQKIIYNFRVEIYGTRNCSEVTI